MDRYTNAPMQINIKKNRKSVSILILRVAVNVFMVFLPVG
jgi:hypothetical protein